jgi:YbbR domain-containing protein
VRYLGSRDLATQRLVLDTRIEEQVPVRLTAEVAPAVGYILTQPPKLSPASVTLSGARSLVSQVQSIPTRSDSVTGLKWNNSIPIPLDLRGLPRFVDVADTSVRLEVRVDALSRRVFTGVPVHLIGVYDINEYALSPATATLEVSGGKHNLDSLLMSDIGLYIEFSRFEIEDADSLAPTVKVPETVQDFRVLPATFKLERN